MYVQKVHDTANLKNLTLKKFYKILTETLLTFIVSIEFIYNNENVFPYHWLDVDNWTSLIIKPWKKITQPLTTLADSRTSIYHWVIHF